MEPHPPTELTKQAVKPGWQVLPSLLPSPPPPPSPTNTCFLSQKVYTPLKQSSPHSKATLCPFTQWGSVCQFPSSPCGQVPAPANCKDRCSEHLISPQRAFLEGEITKTPACTSPPMRVEEELRKQSWQDAANVDSQLDMTCNHLGAKPRSMPVRVFLY